MTKRTLEQQLEKAKQDKAKAESRIKSAASKMREADRRANTRRKIILGGVMLSKAGRSGSWSKVLGEVIESLPERDKAAFSGWSIPKCDTQPKRDDIE